MQTLLIKHTTTYLYHVPVSLGPHRLMLRPRTTQTLIVNDFSLILSPQAQISWHQDSAGNEIATALFQTMTDRLVITAQSKVTFDETEQQAPNLAPEAVSFPFTYPEEDWFDWQSFASPQFVDAEEQLREWTQKFVNAFPTNTIALLTDIMLGVSSSITYQSRDEEGTQSPLVTLARGWGSCRDYAVLFVEAVRSLGFVARLVSGYLVGGVVAHTQTNAQTMMAEIDDNTPHNSTHAWAEVFLPQAGWVAFDPTNRRIGSANLIPVASARTMEQLVPVSGNFIGARTAYCGMMVSVQIAKT